MKPFNLERALAGDPVGTRDGKRKVVQLFYADKAIRNAKVIAVFDDGLLELYAENSGSLVMLPKTKTYWYALLTDNLPGVAITAGYEDKAELEAQVELLVSGFNTELIEIRSIEVEE